MTYRIFKHAGQVTDRVDTYGEGAAISPDEEARAEVAAALNSDVAMVTVEHVDVAPHAQVVIPPSLAAPLEPELQTIISIISKADADVTVAELKAVVLTALRRLRKRGVI